MELIVFITVLCFALLALQTPCASMEMKLQAANEQGIELSRYPSLPRKIRFTEVMVNEAQYPISNTKQKEHVSGKEYHKDHAPLVHGSLGTRQEWVESGSAGVDISQYFTMDYTDIKRRRPVHNKSIPVVP